MMERDHMNRQVPRASGRQTCRGLLVSLSLAVALVAQGVLLSKGTLWPLAQRVWEVRGDPPLERSARLAFGDAFADYMRFLREHVPENARLVVPPKAVVPVYGDIGLMQYFLAPRQIVDCPAGPDLAPCVASMDGARTYILAIPEFPPTDSVPANKEHWDHGGGFGVYAPRP